MILSADAQSSMRTPIGLRITLSVMMFLQHAIIGAWAPLLGLRLEDLAFTGGQITWVYSSMAIATLIAPWLGGQLADRSVPAQFLLCGAHLIGGVLLWQLADVTSFATAMTLMICFSLLYAPTLSLSTTVVLRGLCDPPHEFGGVRMWGTSSWVVVGGAMGIWLTRPAWLPLAAGAEIADGLRLGAILSLALAGYSLLLPHTPPRMSGTARRWAVLEALRLLREPSLAVMIGVSFALALGMAFIYPTGALFLRAVGAPDAWVAPLLSLGQVSEFLVFFGLAPLLRRLGFKRAFALGIAAWGLRFAIWTAGGPWWLIVASLLLHGLCYAFVFGIGQLYVDRVAPPDIRASMQALHLTITMGVGVLLSNVLAGTAMDALHGPGGAGVDFARLYFWPTVGAGVCLVMFWVLFEPAKRAKVARE